MNKITYTKHCELCGTEFTTPIHSRRYCSKSCVRAAYKMRLKEKRKSDAVKTLERSHGLMPEVCYFSVTQTASILGLSRMSVYRMIYDGRLQKCWDTMNGYQMRSLSDELKHSYEKRKGIIRLALEFVALKDRSTFKEEECGMEGVPLSDLDTLSSMVSPSPTHVAAWYVGKDIAEAAAEHQGKFCPVLAVLAKSNPTLK